MNKVIKKYLTNYSEPEVSLLIHFPPDQHYNYCLVIPAYQESVDFITQFFNSRLSQQNVLLIVVVNQPDNALDSKAQFTLFEEAKALGQSVNVNSKCNSSIETLVHVSMPNTPSDLLLVNRFNTPIPEKKGVGLARKIGCDIACALIEDKIITSSFIASSDADARLPDNYFGKQTELHNNKNIKYSVACYSFKHVKTSSFNNTHPYSDELTVFQATSQYEDALRYYVAGLSYANSSYAFFTIGSILLFDATAYASVRGFPQKSAGEDFYLLNKLAKVGSVYTFTDSTIELTARLSNRVPFGTGPAVKKIIDLHNENKVYCYYNPAVFVELKQLNLHVTTLANHLAQIDLWLNLLSAQCQEALILIGFKRFIQQHQNDTQEQFNKQWLVWFDAFKTLKFIHALRETNFPDIPLHEALAIRHF